MAVNSPRAQEFRIECFEEAWELMKEFLDGLDAITADSNSDAEAKVEAIRAWVNGLTDIPGWRTRASNCSVRCNRFLDMLRRQLDASTTTADVKDAIGVLEDLLDGGNADFAEMCEDLGRYYSGDEWIFVCKDTKQTATNLLDVYKDSIAAIKDFHTTIVECFKTVMDALDTSKDISERARPLRRSTRRSSRRSTLRSHPYGLRKRK